MSLEYKYSFILFLFVCLSVVSGCGTVNNVTEDYPPEIYGGTVRTVTTWDRTVHDYWDVSANSYKPHFSTVITYNVLLMPFRTGLNVVGDTITAPFVAPFHITNMIQNENDLEYSNAR